MATSTAKVAADTTDVDAALVGTSATAVASVPPVERARADRVLLGFTLFNDPGVR